MTLPTGVAALAENNYGRPDKALDYLHRMSRSWGYAHPGSMYEVVPILNDVSGLEHLFRLSRTPVLWSSTGSTAAYNHR